jgi:hypothetical protein
MIRSELDVLLDKIDDEALRAELRIQIDRLKQKRSFGLVFERHIPERVRLPQHPIRVGSQVAGRGVPPSVRGLPARGRERLIHTVYLNARPREAGLTVATIRA